MFTAQQIFDLAMDFVNKRLASGTINATTTALYKVRSPGILTAWQNELADSGDLYSTYEISNKPFNSLFGYKTGFDVKEYLGTEDLSLECNGSVKTYYFEVDAPCVVTIEDYTSGWNVKYTHTLQGSDFPSSTVPSYIARSGTITPTVGATKSRFRVSGGTYARIKNYAMFDIAFHTGREPVYKPWVKYQMPSDFKGVDHIIDEDSNLQYLRDSDYKWEGRKDLYIDYFYDGNIRIVYKPVPTPITALTQTLQVDEITSMCGAYFLAAHLLLVEDPSSASYFNQRFEDLKRDSFKKQPTSEVQILDVYGGF